MRFGHFQPTGSQESSERLLHFRASLAIISEFAKTAPVAADGSVTTPSTAEAERYARGDVSEEEKEEAKYKYWLAVKEHTAAGVASGAIHDCHFKHDCGRGRRMDELSASEERRSNAASAIENNVL